MSPTFVFLKSLFQVHSITAVPQPRCTNRCRSAAQSCGLAPQATGGCFIEESNRLIDCLINEVIHSLIKQLIN